MKIAAGTDTLGDLNEEIALMHRFGMTTHEALETATINAARLMELDTQIGSLEPGKLADFIVLRSDPFGGLVRSLRYRRHLPGWTLYPHLCHRRCGAAVRYVGQKLVNE